jgi:hypothetical protein
VRRLRRRREASFGLGWTTDCLWRSRPPWPSTFIISASLSNLASRAAPLREYAICGCSGECFPLHNGDSQKSRQFAKRGQLCGCVLHFGSRRPPRRQPSTEEFFPSEHREELMYSSLAAASRCWRVEFPRRQASREFVVAKYCP